MLGKLKEIKLLLNGLLDGNHKELLLQKLQITQLVFSSDLDLHKLTHTSGLVKLLHLTQLDLKLCTNLPCNSEKSLYQPNQSHLVILSS